MVFWRSAARHPWYNDVFERAGFNIEVFGMRDEPRKAIDRVNMWVIQTLLLMLLLPEAAIHC
jgi:betaine lipid synthase